LLKTKPFVQLDGAGVEGEGVEADGVHAADAESPVNDPIDSLGCFDGIISIFFPSFLFYGLTFFPTRSWAVDR
jgi:hypothetical protein